MSFSKISQILFIVGPTFPILIPECLNNSQWWFSSSFSTFEDRRRVFLHILSVLLRIHGSSSVSSSHYCFRLWDILFTHPEQSRTPFSLILRRLSLRDYSFQLSAIVLQILPVHHSNFSNQPASLRSLVSKFSQVSLFVFKFLPVIHLFSSFILNSYGASFKISLPPYHIYLFVVSILPAVRWRPFQVAQYLS